eukprot:CAMPEP_0113500626 /NCGR_PEP_ID=MMETSP0014_2-20120614/32445_1 /TAXON_ID=2857 /ORGANISM="Nitzschia sp." /LENGTH=159 /DNA_ID=CAMNT_0000395007 /DNA_START=524 /DNA_END=1000 /DNA_ORIENTATION=- /assembly_acc=CAM_ASM_000159
MFRILSSFSDKEIDVIGDEFWLGVVINFLFPLQGFFFFLIYIRPRYLTLRRENQRRWYAFYTAIIYPIPKPGAVSERFSSNRAQSFRINSGDVVPPVAMASTDRHDVIEKYDDGGNDYDNSKRQGNGNTIQNHDDDSVQYVDNIQKQQNDGLPRSYGTE